MFIAMLHFVKVPDQCDLITGFPGGANSQLSDAEYVQAWYIYCLILHGILAAIHFASIFFEDEINNHAASGFMSIQLMAVLLQIANLCFMLSLYGNSVMQGTSITPEARVFQFWVLVEIIVMMCTIFNSMFYLLLRSIRRDAQFYQVMEVPDTT